MSRRCVVVMVTVLAWLCPALLASSPDEDIVIPPPSTANASAPEKLLVYIPGGLVPNNNYTKTAEAIQNASELRLWVVIPAVTQRLCIIECASKHLCAPLHETVARAVSKAKSAGCTVTNSAKDSFIAGHSLGGTCAQTLVQAYNESTEYSALLVMGSYVDETGTGDLTNFPIPALTLGAELDGGMARPGKMTLWYEQFKNFSSTTTHFEAIQRKPVIVIPLIDHSDFCPGFKVAGDLPSEMDQDDATAIIGKVSGAFLHMNSPEVSNATVFAAETLLSLHVNETERLLSPIVQALSLETTAGATGEFVPGFGWAHSPWCHRAQHIIAQLDPDDDAKMTVYDTYHDKASDSPGDGGVSFEHCHTNQTVSRGDQNNNEHFHNNSADIVAHVCSHNAYFTDVDNTGTFICAAELGCKMASAGQIRKVMQIGGGADPRNVTCADVNNAAVAVATELLGKYNPASLERYNKKGRTFCFRKDVAAPGNIAPLWVSERLKWDETSNPNCVEVTSIAEFSPLTSKIFPGNFYCKLLSPARALDWMMTDSLKPFSG